MASYLTGITLTTLGLLRRKRHLKWQKAESKTLIMSMFEMFWLKGKTATLAST
ncbi:hypothetical protein I5189_06245 [Pseudomonas aeruginosa]|nr:hypothetical protein PA39016_001440000 [Pseudomonas aeruginosa 39016]KYO74645.1 hypothetical protein LL05_06459 [Pseudomonas aeruginosa]MBK3718561.1 hypothetical protein [Pseudomonas aeruginosa]CDM50690.1 hypothetical protein PAWS394_1731 [Pseudomonas aeruginosa WS394]